MLVTSDIAPPVFPNEWPAALHGVGGVSVYKVEEKGLELMYL